MRRWMATAVALALVGVGCDGNQATQSTVSSPEAPAVTVPTTTTAAPPTTASTTITAESPEATSLDPEAVCDRFVENSDMDWTVSRADWAVDGATIVCLVLGFIAAPGGPQLPGATKPPYDASIWLIGPDGSAKLHSAGWSTTAPYLFDDLVAPATEPPPAPESRWQPDLDLPPFPGQEELLAAWAKWEEQGPVDYKFVVSGGSFFSGGEYRVFVSGDEWRVVTLEPPYLNAGGVLGAIGPIERLFAFVESIASEHLAVSYDPTWGYPTRLNHAPDPLSDLWWEVHLSHFVILDRPSNKGGDLDGLMTPWWQGFRAHAVVEATIVGPVEPIGGNWAGWIVAIEDTAVLYLNGTISPTDGYIRASGIIYTQVADSVNQGPGALRGMEGERLVLFLTYSGNSIIEERPGFRVKWAARHTDNGLEFIGPPATFTTINQDLPTLCGPNDGPRDADQELDLLIRLIDSVHGDWEEAVETACNPEG